MKKILIIDDNADLANGLAKLFSLSGYTDVSCAYLGHAGIKLASEIHPEVILVDLQMPDMDGFAVVKAIREQSAKPAPICIAVTGYGRDSDKQKTREADFDFHLTKPFSFQELEKILKLSDKKGSALRA